MVYVTYLNFKIHEESCKYLLRKAGTQVSCRGGGRYTLRPRAYQPGVICSTFHRLYHNLEYLEAKTKFKSL